MKNRDTKTFFLIAGEPSGDLLGARLIRALQTQEPSHALTFAGIGGPEMERAGHFQSLFPMSELSHMGILEILPHIPHLLRRIRQTTAHILQLKPNALITIDAPEFSLRVAQKVARTNPSPPLKRIHCVAPSVWAWRPGRAKKIAGFLDHLLALFPFEPPYFEKEGLPCTFVGHPLLEQPKGSAARFYEKYPDLDPRLPLLCLLPGSRQGEVKRLLPIFAQTIAKIRETVPHFNVVLPTVPPVASLVRQGLSLFELPLLIPEMADRFDAFAAATVALAASGTVALELAFHETPLVVAYQASWLTEAILKRLVLVPHVCLINLILGDSLVPECLQKDCTPERLASEVIHLLTTPSALKKQKQGLQQAIQSLYADQPFSQKAAEAILGKTMRDS